MTKRRSVPARLALAMAVVATLLLPGSAGAWVTTTVGNTTTGGSVTAFFDHSPLLGCPYQFNQRTTVNYGKVTSTTIYIKTIDVYEYPLAGDAVLGYFVRINNDSGAFARRTWDNGYVGEVGGHTQWYTKVAVKTFTINATVAFEGGAILVWRQAAVSKNNVTQVESGCVTAGDFLYIFHS